jgi:sugar diacid utilization regulator
MTPGLAGTRVAQERRPGASLDSTATRARRGGGLGTLRVRRAYTPCLLSWVDGAPTTSRIDEMWRAALDWDRRSLLVSLDAATQMLLVAVEHELGREHVAAALRSVVSAARAGQPAARIQAVVGDRMSPGEPLAPAAASLRRLARRALERGGEEIVWAQRRSLASLLASLDQRQAAGFVDEHLATLRDYDREHGTDLQHVLELALDHRDRNTAASAAFMHRNTFRRQVGKALELAGVDLADPEDRLALHLALKLREQLARE